MKDQLQSLIDNLNQGFECGSVEIMEYDPKSGFEEEYSLLPTDITIYYDFIADDEPVENQAMNEYESALDITDQFMDQNGWYEVNQLDGSGGGLWYGSSTYRKIS